MLVSSGADIRDIQEILGHASILSTQVYTRLPIQKRRAAAPAAIAPTVVVGDAPRVILEPAAAKLSIKK
jgi:hypothetical protein